MAVSEKNGMHRFFRSIYAPPDDLWFRLQIFRTRLAKIFATQEEDRELLFPKMLEMINEGLSTEELFGTAEATAACKTMDEADEVMFHEGIVHKV